MKKRNAFLCTFLAVTLYGLTGWADCMLQSNGQWVCGRGPCAMNSNGTVTCGDCADDQCHMGSNGINYCGKDCQLNSDGTWTCEPSDPWCH